MEQQRHNADSVSIIARARLHLGFLDMSGALGRRFGSLGMSIEAFSTRLNARRGQGVVARGPAAERTALFAKRVLAGIDTNFGVEISVDQVIPDHLGLGSGTQLALAVGRAVTLLYGREEVSTREIARTLQRGARSGIGIGAFDHGGFLVDSGVDGEGVVPPVVARLAFPDEWRVLLVLDARGKGLHGCAESEAFHELPPFPAEKAARLCHLAMMQILPALQERKFQPVADGIAELQRTVGDHFAPAQGGRFTSPAVARALECAAAQGYSGIGQSSWGPTGFVLVPHVAAAEELKHRLTAQFGSLSPLRYLVTSACNQGSIIHKERHIDTLREIR